MKYGELPLEVSESAFTNFDKFILGLYEFEVREVVFEAEYHMGYPDVAEVLIVRNRVVAGPQVMIKTIAGDIVPGQQNDSDKFTSFYRMKEIMLRWLQELFVACDLPSPEDLESVRRSHLKLVGRRYIATMTEKDGFYGLKDLH